MSFFWLITLYEFGLIYIKIYISGPGTETVRQRYQVSTVRRFQVYQQFLCRKFRIQAEQSTCVLLSFLVAVDIYPKKGLNFNLFCKYYLLRTGSWRRSWILDNKRGIPHLVGQRWELTRIMTRHRDHVLKGQCQKIFTSSNDFT